MNTAHATLTDDAIYKAKRRIASITWLPSPILHKTLLGVQDNLDELIRAIEKDPSLASVVLKVSNSSFFGCRGKIDSIPRAIVILGQREVRLLILSILVHQQLTARRTHPAFSMERFWRHSFLTALVARELSSAEAAYLHGLIHDIGLIAMAAFLPDLFGEAAAISAERGISLYEAEKEIGLTHTVVSSWLGVKWGLPPVLRAILTHHHEPENAGAFQKETAAVAVADALARMAEKELTENGKAPKGKKHLVPINEKFLGLARISPREYISLWGRMPDLIKKVHSHWLTMNTSA